MQTRLRLIRSIITQLQTSELSDEERDVFNEGQLDLKTLGFVLVAAATYQRLDTFATLLSLNVDLTNFKQWIAGQAVVSDLTQTLSQPLPDFEHTFEQVIASDNAELLIRFMAISDDIQPTIVSYLQDLDIRTKVRLQHIQEAFPTVSADVESYKHSIEEILRFMQAIQTCQLDQLRASQTQFSRQIQQWFVVLAASTLSTDVLRVLIEEKKFDCSALSLWANSEFPDRAVPGPFPLAHEFHILPLREVLSLLNVRCEKREMAANKEIEFLRLLLPRIPLDLANIERPCKYLLTAATHLLSVLDNIHNQQSIQSEHLEWVNWLMTKYPALTVSLKQIIFSTDNLGLFCTFYDEVTFNDLHRDMQRALLIDAAKADAVEIFTYLSSTYPSLANMPTRAALRQFIDDAHPKANAAIQSVLDSPLPVPPPLPMAPSLAPLPSFASRNSAPQFDAYRSAAPQFSRSLFDQPRESAGYRNDRQPSPRERKQ